MTSANVEPFDFDFDFLVNQPTTNITDPETQARVERLRKSVIYLKPKVKELSHYITSLKHANREIEEYKFSSAQMKESFIQQLVKTNHITNDCNRFESNWHAALAREKVKDETIAELQNKVIALQTVHTQLKLLAKERNNTEPTLVQLEKKKGKAGVTDNAKKVLKLEKEVERLRKENAKLLSLQKENEKLRKDVSRIPSLEKEIDYLCKNDIKVSKSERVNDLNEITKILKFDKEIETLRKEKAKILRFEQEIEILNKENAKIPKFEKEIENLKKENIKIPKLEKEIEMIRKENAKIPKLENEIKKLHKENEKIPEMLKEIGNLQKENAKIPKLVKEIENLRKENSKVSKLRNDKETIVKQNVKILNLEKDIEILRIKNAKIEIANKAFSKDAVKISNKREHFETSLPLLTTTKEKGDLLQKSNHTRTCKSLPNTNSKHCDNTEAENDVYEDQLLSPAPNDVTDVTTPSVANKDILEDNNNSIEVISDDTGRGSSPANSDNDGPHSPEYLFNNGPQNEDNIENIETAENTAVTSSPISKHKENRNACELKSVSFRKSNSKLLSTINQTNTAKVVDNSVDTSRNISSTHDVQEKQCLELNNSLRRETHIDLELEQIFSEMSFNFNALSPIPRTPTWMHEENYKAGSSELRKKTDTSDEFMRMITVILLRYVQARNSNSNSSIDKLVTCLESISKSKENQPLNSLLDSVTDFDQSDCVLLHDDGNSMSKSIRESTATSHEKNEESLQINNCENRAAQNMSLSMLQDENQNQLDPNASNSASVNPSSAEKDTSILKDKQAEKKFTQCSPMPMDKNRQTCNQPISENLATDNETSKVVRVRKNVKNKNKSKLEKLKKNLKPKYKIRRENAPKNLRIKPKQLISNKKTVTANDTSASMNNKDVYEKAVKVMAEINSQQNAKLIKSPQKHANIVMSPKQACLEKNIPNSGVPTSPGKLNISEFLNTCSVVLIKDKLLLSPCKVGNSTIYQAKETKKNNNLMTNKPNEENYRTETEKEDSTISTAKDNNNSSTHRLKDNNNSTTHTPRDNNNSSIHKTNEVNNATTQITKDNNISMAHKAKENKSMVNKAKENNNLPSEETTVTHKGELDKNVDTHGSKDNKESIDELPPRKRRRRSSNEILPQNKRVLRSDTLHKRLSTEDNIELSRAGSNRKSTKEPSANDSNTQLLEPRSQSHENTSQNVPLDQHDNKVVSYGDLDIFSEDIQLENSSAPAKEVNADSTTCQPKESILCSMIEKYGVETIKPFEKKIPDKIVKQVCEKIEQEITTIGLMKDTKTAMNNFVADLRKINYKYFVAGLMKYLVKPERKIELFGKVSSSPAPAMTKAEQILLYVISHLKTQWPTVDIVDAILCSIEFTLFKLNRTPEFDVIESTSHFYAVLCRYFRAKSRLRLFILDAMYCIQFKSVPLIKQCLDVWMHIIPLAHMGIAKSPVVTCLVYLLHFYKCDDRHNRVQDMRNILSRKYFYQITDWNETKILEMFKNSIKELRDISIEKKMLRLALIILAKRHGPQWCQLNIIKNLLQPMIEKENVPNIVKEFCVSVIGPLMKPYPADMKVHCEIAINQLVNILNNNPTAEMEEAAISSMIYINRHDQRSINKTLLSRKMKPMSLELEKTIRDYVKSKPLKVWKKNLATITR